MRRVLFVDHVNRILGGAEINLVELIGEIASQKDWQALCACVPGGRLNSALQASGIRVYDFGFSEDLNQLRVVGKRPSLFGAMAGLRGMGQARIRLAAILDETKPDVVITCTNKDHLCAAPICHERGIPSIWWVNDIISADFFPWYARHAFLRAARKYASKLVTVSEFSRQALLSQGLEATKVAAIPNGIPIERYQRTPPGTLRKQIGAARETRLVGLVGRITPWKGQEFFLQLAQASQSLLPQAQFVIIGNAFNEDQAFETKLREIVAVKHLESRVWFVPFHENIPAVLSDLDVLVHASLRPEPFGRVIIEAMAIGVPIIAAKAGGVPEIVTHGVDGLLADPGHMPDYFEP